MQVIVGTQDTLTVQGDCTVLKVEVPKKETDLRTFVAFVRSIVSNARRYKQHEIVVDAQQLSTFPCAQDIKPYELGRHFAENVFLAGYQYLAYKSVKPESSPDLTVYLTKPSYEFMRGLTDGVIVGDACNRMRDLANAPPNVLNPEQFAQEVERMFDGLDHTSVKVLNARGMKALNMDLLLAVGQGARAEPRLIVVEYAGGVEDEPYEVLVGKGITYDTGGINLKGSDGLVSMEKDMSGGAAVVCALYAAIKLGVKRNIVAIVPAAENAIGGNAVLTTSIITSMSGKTVYIGNTDAEGRLVLADAITYAGKYYPTAPRVMTVATLTGACIIALGQYACGLFTENRALEDKLRAVGADADDYLWPLPSGNVYDEELKHDVADMNNVQTSKYGGATIGFRFLVPFSAAAGFKDHVHVDMAPRMNAVTGDNIGKGASGDPVRFLARYLQNATR